MEPFYFIVLGVTTIILIILLTIIGITMSKPNNQEVYPPSKLACPDYWASSDSGCTWTANKNSPTGTVQTSDTYGFSSGSTTINFGHASWNSDICQYKKWANRYGVTWDGITNYNGC
jgi:hypothetical protein